LLATYDERIRDIYKTYIEDISLLILQYEVLSVGFPIGIINEIRAVFTHLAKHNLSDDASEKEINLSKAEGHIKRAKLDCYKYIWSFFEDEYSKFDKTYKDVDLSLVEDGKFLLKLIKARENAKHLLLEARKTDLSIDSDDETKTNESYEKYEKAYVAYSSMHKLINDSSAKCESLKRKAVTKNKKSTIFGIIGIAIGILGIIIGIIF
jgi:hypothetical protein